MVNEPVQQSGIAARLTSVRGLLLLLSACLLALHFVHLGSDALTGTPWGSDPARFTDEGWYGDAAARERLFGHWYVAGDFNPAAALPVLPLLQIVPFGLLGVSPQGTRGFAVVLLIVTCGLLWRLLRLWRRSDDDPAAELAVLFLAASPFVFAFSRMALLELPSALFLALALLTAEACGPGRRWPAVSVGLLTATALLTKSTIAFALPAVPVVLWARAMETGNKARVRQMCEWLALASFGAVLVFAVWALWVWHAGLMTDVYMLFYLNGERARHGEFPRLAWQVLLHLRWIGVCFGPLGALACLASLLRWRGARLAPPAPRDLALLLWVAGPLCFIVVHKMMPPRYFFVPAVALLMVLAREAGALLVHLRGRSRAPVAFLLLLATAWESAQTVRYAMHPAWTFSEAARAIRHEIDREPERSRVVLGSSAADLALVNGLPHLNGLFATLPVAELAERYRPGWVLLWQTKDGADAEPKLSVPLRSHFILHEVGRWSVMDLPERQVLVLYRLDLR